MIKRIEVPIFNSKEAAEEHGLQLVKSGLTSDVAKYPASLDRIPAEGGNQGKAQVGRDQQLVLVPGFGTLPLHINECHPVRLEDPPLLGDARRRRLGESYSCQDDEMGLTLEPDREYHGTDLLG